MFKRSAKPTAIDAKPAASDDRSVKQRVLDAGRAEFARRGFTASSVRVIGERAGVTPAMINYYFGGKRALYEAIVAEAEGRLHERLSAAVDAGGRGGLAPRLAAAYFDFLAEDRDLQSLLLREVLDRDRAAGGPRPRGRSARAPEGGALGDLGARYVRPLRALLAQHFGDGDEALQLAVSLFGAVAGYFLYEPLLGAFLGADPRSPEALARRRRHVVHLATLFEKVPR